MLTGLIFTDDEIWFSTDRVAEADRLHAQVIETQVRRLHEAGAQTIWVSAKEDQLLPVTVVARLRSEGLPVVVVTAPGQLTRANPLIPVIILGAAVVADAGLIVELAGEPGNVILVASPAANNGLERIDRDTAWAGVMRIEAALLSATIDDLGEWDLGSTLLRRAVQARAQLRRASADTPGLSVLGTPEAAWRWVQERMASGVASHASWPQRQLARIAGIPFLRWADQEPLRQRGLIPTAITLFGLGLLALVMGQGALGLTMILCDLPLLAAVQISLALRRPRDWIKRTALWDVGLAVAVLGTWTAGLSQATGLTWTLAIGTVIAWGTAFRGGGPGAGWTPSLTTLVPLLLVGSVTGWRDVALAMVALHAVAAQIGTVERLRRQG